MIQESKHRVSWWWDSRETKRSEHTFSGVIHHILVIITVINLSCQLPLLRYSSQGLNHKHLPNKTTKPSVQCMLSSTKTTKTTRLGFYKYQKRLTAIFWVKQDGRMQPLATIYHDFYQPSYRIEGHLILSRVTYDLSIMSRLWCF